MVPPLRLRRSDDALYLRRREAQGDVSESRVEKIYLTYSYNSGIMGHKEVNNMDLKTEFIKTVQTNIQREGINDLMEWLEDTDFYTAPASTRFHGAEEGGLLLHSMNVYCQLKRLCGFYGLEVSEESIAIVALFHDLCKVGCYKTEMRWKKDENDKWVQYPTYKFEEDFAYGGHGSKSVFLVMSFMKLFPDEAAAINCHMGQWDATQYSNPSEAYSRNHLAWLLHVADEAADFILGT